MSCKTCSKCKINKPYQEFYPNRRGVGGVGSWCKECARTDARVRRQRDLGKAREYGRRYYSENREKLLAAANDNLSTPRGRIDNAISCGVGRGIRRGTKNGRRAFELLGYTLSDLMAHLETQFEPWMTWENYGFYGWHIDHIRPLASFNYETPDDPQFKAAWALSNLRPLRAVENWRKGYTDMPELYEAANDNDNDGETSDSEGEGSDNRARQAR